MRDSILLTGTRVQPEAIVERSITDKNVKIGEKTRLGAISATGDPVITMVGKNSMIPNGYVIEPGAIIGTDVIEEDYPSNLVRSEDYIQTKRLAYEV